MDHFYINTISWQAEIGNACRDRLLNFTSSFQVVFSLTALGHKHTLITRIAQAKIERIMFSFPPIRQNSELWMASFSVWSLHVLAMFLLYSRYSKNRHIQIIWDSKLPLGMNMRMNVSFVGLLTSSGCLHLIQYVLAAAEPWAGKIMAGKYRHKYKCSNSKKETFCLSNLPTQLLFNIKEQISE